MARLPDTVPHTTCWAVAQEHRGSLSVIYRSFRHTRKDAMASALKIAAPPYTTKQLHAMGYRVRRVRIYLEPGKEKP